MASNVPDVRFVRCPKCRNLIAEFANIPLYQCGGCGTILRAKYHIATGENVNSESLENSLKNTSDGGSLGRGLTSSGQKMIDSSLEANNREANGSTNCNEKGESFEHSEHGTEERDVNNNSPRLTDPLALETETNLNVEVEKLLNLSHEGSKAIDKMEESAEPIVQDVASEDMVDSSLGDMQGDSLRYGSATRSSHVYYDGSASSPDDGCGNRPPNKYLLLSKRTFRRKIVLDMIDSKGKSAKENRLANNELTAELGSQLKSTSFPEKSSNERYTSTTASSSDSIRAELSSIYDLDALKRESSLESEDFHSVQNWMEPEKVVQSKSLSRDSVVCGDSFNRQNDNPAKLRSLRPHHKKILRKVDELRDELSELFDQKIEGKRKSHLRGIREEELTPGLGSNLVHLSDSYMTRKNVPQQFQSSEALLLGKDDCSCLHCHPEVRRSAMQSPPKVCCCNGLCRACPKDTRSHPLAHEHELKKPHCKEGGQPVRRHCRPVSGGAPFVVCYKCLKLLQLPADFLVSRGRLHKLQCGACSEVLLYSFRPRASKVPHTLDGTRHPPSEVDNSTDAMTRHEVPSSDSNKYTKEEPISFAEEYGVSYAKSNSSEPETVLHVSRSSSYPTEEQSDKQVKAPQLHRLLGYNSASELLYRFSDSDEGYHSIRPATPHFYKPSVDIDTRDGTGGAGIRTDHEHSAGGSPTTFMEIREEHDLPRRSRIRRGASPLRGLLKKGIRELNHGLDSVKLKIQSHGITNPDW